jgi:hypothetical protein
MKTIIEMAREAGMAGLDGVVHAAFQLEAFAELVRADEREENARVCEKVAVDYYTRIGREHEPYMKATAEDCAMQIRERGQPKRKWVGLTKDEALKLALETLESSRVFVMSREMIKRPEGADWYDSRITAIKEALAQPTQIDPNQWAFDNGLEST